MPNLELLAPAGNWESLVAAVENGADAVYLGVRAFNARQSATNFSYDELAKALEYAHIRGVKLYLTLNTLIADSELQSALTVAQKVYELGIDSVIVQDIGLARLLRQNLPNLAIHASTQMTIASAQGIAVATEWGFRRVVLARELSLDEISEFAKLNLLELEVFVHGALCICYSGQCLMSSIIGQRSGNRGQCAQPCRMMYSLYDNQQKQRATGYLLSPKDISNIEYLQQLRQAGVASLKIEGRMKTPEYVATVVKIYRRALDTGKISVDDYQNLLQIFNRGGFISGGYLLGKPGPQLLSHEKPKNWGILLGFIVAWDHHRQLVQIQLQTNLCQGDGIEIWNNDNENPNTIVTEIRDQHGNQISEARSSTLVWVGRITGKWNRNDRVFRTSSKALNEQARQTFLYGKSIRKIYVHGIFNWDEQKGATLTVHDEKGHTATASQLPSYTGHPLPIHRVIEQLNKIKDTPFLFQSLTTQDQQGQPCDLAKSTLQCDLTISALNHLRRSVLADLEHELANSGPKTSEPPLSNSSNSGAKTSEPPLSNSSNSGLKTSEPGLSLMLYRSNIQNILPYVQNVRIYLPILSFCQEPTLWDSELLRQKNIELGTWISPIVRGKYQELVYTCLPQIAEKIRAGCWVGNLGMIRYLRRNFPNLPCHADIASNVFNHSSINVLKNFGVSTIACSPEMTLSQIQNLAKILLQSTATSNSAPTATSNFSCLEALVYGRIPLMICEVCPSAMMSKLALHTTDQNKLQRPSSVANQNKLQRPSSVADQNSLPRHLSCSLCKGCSIQKTPTDHSHLAEDFTSWQLEDRLGIRFPLLWSSTLSQSLILNSKILFVPHIMQQCIQAGMYSFRMTFYEESDEQIISLVKTYQQILLDPSKILKTPSPENLYTHGHYFRGVIEE